MITYRASRKTALLIAVCVANTMTFAERATKETAAPASLTVSVAQSQQVIWPVTVPASGVVVAWQEAVVSSRTNGLPLVAVSVDAGQFVRKGELLARFDDRSVRAEIAQAEASLAQALASSRQSVTNRDRTVALRGTGAVSEESILQAETNAETAIAQVAVAQANLDSARVRLENTLVVAPDAGLVVSRTATLGQAFAVTTELFRMNRQGRLEWRAEVNSAELSSIKKGQTAQITLPNATKVRARVRQILPSISAATRLATVQLDVDPNADVKPQMFAEGQIQIGERTAIVVPAESVVIRDGKSYVFVIEGDRAKRKLVSTGRRKGALIELISGIDTDVRVAARGAGFLSDDDRVLIQNTRPASAPALPAKNGKS